MMTGPEGLLLFEIPDNSGRDGRLLLQLSKIDLLFLSVQIWIYKTREALSRH